MENAGLVLSFTKTGNSKRRIQYEEPACRDCRVPSISYDLDPCPKGLYQTVQSRKFAIQAKKYLQIHLLLPKRRTGDKENNNNKNYHHKMRFFCFPFLHAPARDRRHTTKGKVPELAAPEEVLCELVGESLIMKDYHIRSLGIELPARAIGCPWTLKFCTSKDGYSLHNLYRKLHKVDSPVLIVVEDLQGRVFGGLSSSSIKVSDKFFGTSECFLFSCFPEFNVFKWNGDNFYFVQASEEFLAFGSGLGKPGLWLDSDLNKGTTERCLTYGNHPLVPESDFIIKNLECWTFG